MALDSSFGEHYLQVLMERISQDTYPSIAQMDLVESLLPPEHMDSYLAILMAKLEADRYPSTEMLNRVRRLVVQLPQAS